MHSLEVYVLNMRAITANIQVAVVVGVVVVVKCVCVVCVRSGGVPICRLNLHAWKVQKTQWQVYIVDARILHTVNASRADTQRIRMQRHRSLLSRFCMCLYTYTD